MTEPSPNERPPARSAIDRAFLTADPDAGELILVRHGEQDFPPDWTVGGDFVDPPLSARGERQADAAGRALSTRPVTALYASNLQRARRTADAIGAHHGLTPTIVPDLREIEMFRGLPPGMTLVDAVGADVLRTAGTAFVDTRRWDVYPATETGEQLRARVVPAVEAILAAHPAEVVVVACHGGVINGYLGHVLGLAEDMFFRPAHASFHRIAFAGTRRVIGALNGIEHLPGELLSW